MAVASDSTFAPEGGAHHRGRRALEGYIERLIALLDELDGDPDLEDSDDAEPDNDGEPSLGWPESFGRRQQLSFEGLRIQSEDGEAEDGGDREPWLGSLDHPHHPQTFWARSGLDDREADAGDEGEPDIQDGEGEFAGGCLLGADEKPEPTTDVNPDAWVRA